MNYEVVWDGAHRGKNADLLCAAPIAGARAADMPARWLAADLPTPRESRQQFCEAVYQELARLLTGDTWWTVVQMVEETSYAAADIQIALMRLRRSGQLLKRFRAHTNRSRQGGWLEYRILRSGTVG